jgi:hypothetical protein
LNDFFSSAVMGLLQTRTITEAEIEACQLDVGMEYRSQSDVGAVSSTKTTTTIIDRLACMA